MPVKSKPRVVRTKVKPEVARTGSIDPDWLYTYAQIAEFASVDERRVRQWVEDGKLDYTPLPGGRGRRISGAQWLETIRSSAVSAVR
jgi:hypothetical protein